MPIKTSIQSLLVKNAQSIINTFSREFDSHDFILALINEDEDGYVRELYGCVDSKGGIFKNFHRQIAIYLSENKESLGIKSDGKVDSENIKGYISENEKWSKVD